MRQLLVGDIEEGLMDISLEVVWNSVQEKLLFRSKHNHPYYISAPPWLRTSAGIRGLYLLCHALNRMGYEAYIMNSPYGEFRHGWTTSELLAPMLDRKQAQVHFTERRTPIQVYSETISGNPLQAPVVARWVMNFPGLLGGDKAYDPAEICFGYCQELAAAGGNPDQVLHMPTIDTDIFFPPTKPVQRKGGCFFASKYKNVHHGKLFPITKSCTEITRDLPDSPSSCEVAELLRRSEVFYTYENTALATEAVLCGCPAVFLPNPHLTEIIARKELGPEGYAWGMDPEEIARAKATVNQGAINYLKTYDLFWTQLNQFVAITQERARAVPYVRMMEIPSWSQENHCLNTIDQRDPMYFFKGFFRSLERKWRHWIRRLD